MKDNVGVLLRWELSQILIYITNGPKWEKKKKKQTGAFLFPNSWGRERKLAYYYYYYLFIFRIQNPTLFFFDSLIDMQPTDTSTWDSLIDRQPTDTSTWDSLIDMQPRKPHLLIDSPENFCLMSFDTFQTNVFLA